jgi:hypothetical protein
MTAAVSGLAGVQGRRADRGTAQVRMEHTGLATLENSTLGIVLKVPRATTGPDALIMDEYRMIGQAGTMETVTYTKPASARLTELNPRAAE